MSKIIGFLFPWLNMFRRLELEKRWWHRLAIVLLVFALAPALLYSWVIADDACSPVNSFEPDIMYLGSSVAPSDVPPMREGTPVYDPNSFGPLLGPTTAPAPWVGKSIEMPDGKTVTYPGTTPDETINAEWQHKRNIANAKAAVFGFGWAILVTLLFSYFLQAAYKALLYVIYGGKVGRDRGEVT